VLGGKSKTFSGFLYQQQYESKRNVPITRQTERPRIKDAQKQSLLEIASIQAFGFQYRGRE
jgi:hypothetical protein